MTAGGCREALVSASTIDRARSLDEAYPACACEQWSLAEEHPDPVADGEIIARVLTSPDGYDEDQQTILTAKLTDIYSVGLSVIRQSASDCEIRDTVNTLLSGGHEQRRLVGAVVVPAITFREFRESEGERWFGVYATDAEQNTHHGDVLGTFPDASKSQVKKITSSRRYRLAENLSDKIVFADDPEDLLLKLREAGI